MRLAPVPASSATCPKSSLTGRHVSAGSRASPALSLLVELGPEVTTLKPRAPKKANQKGNISRNRSASGMPRTSPPCAERTSPRNIVSFSSVWSVPVFSPVEASA